MQPVTIKQSLIIEHTTQTVESGIHEDFHRFIKDMQYVYKAILVLSLKTQHNEQLSVTQWVRILLDGKMIGMMVIENTRPPYKTVYALQHIFLNPSYRGGGLGKILLSDLREQYKGCKVFLSCYDEGLSHFYGKNGFMYMGTVGLSPMGKLCHRSDKKYIHCTEKFTREDMAWAVKRFNL
jgi:GNAT superfamily N-acetyltransferase